MKKKKNKIDGNFTAIEHNILNSEAWKGLSIHTKWLYFEFKVRFNGDNKHNISFTHWEGIKIMTNRTFIKSKNKLIERGFIDLIKRGGFYHEATIYGLSERWRKYGTKDFIEVDTKNIEHL
jgi:hypothetical protein